ncbi:MAG TPA: DUF448 domain-containing protein [Trueperaceae bacterium]|nr:DUF448 domain-containing protein [Trueperaceae bacterium]
MVATQKGQPHRKRHVPLRRCAICRESKPQALMLRLARAEDGTYEYDARRRLGGRGTWVCHDCAAQAVTDENTKRLGRAFKGQAEQVLGLLRDAAKRPQGSGRATPPTAAVTARRDGGTDVG